MCTYRGQHNNAVVSLDLAAVDELKSCLDLVLVHILLPLAVWNVDKMEAFVRNSSSGRGLVLAAVDAVIQQFSNIPGDSILCRQRHLGITRRESADVQQTMNFLSCEDTFALAVPTS